MLKAAHHGPAETIPMTAVARLMALQPLEPGYRADEGTPCGAFGIKPGELQHARSSGAEDSSAPPGPVPPIRSNAALS
jgi:hypothetical protein